MTSGNKKILSILIKAGVLILAFGFIYDVLADNQNIRDFLTLLESIRPLKVALVLSIIFILMLLNWYVESIKWKYLIKKIEPISTWKSIESVLCGLTWAVFTPNRIGEFGGRVLFLSPRKRVMGAFSMGIGAFSQLILTNILGSIALLWFVTTFLGLNILLNFALTFLVAIFCSFYLLFYFNIHWVDGLLSRIKFLVNYRKFFRVFAWYNQKDLLKVLGYSFCRFSIFTSQYYFIISLLIPEMPVLPMIMVILILFFVQSALPSLALLDIGVRAFTAGYFFSFLTSHEVAVMAATACIWLINLIIPAIFGSIFVLKLNFFGKSST